MVEGYLSEINGSVLVINNGEVIDRVNEYVDTRSVHPTYINGFRAVRLEGKPRSISVDDARLVVKALGL